jgi:hypothetical protein
MPHLRGCAQPQIGEKHFRYTEAEPCRPTARNVVRSLRPHTRANPASVRRNSPPPSCAHDGSPANLRQTAESTRDGAPMRALQFNDFLHCRSGATHPLLSWASMYIVYALFGRAKINLGAVRLSKRDARDHSVFAKKWKAGGADRLARDRAERVRARPTRRAHARHTCGRGVAFTPPTRRARCRIRRYTSHNVIASRSEVIASRVGMNSCAI